MCVCICVIFFFNDTAPTEIYTLSLHDALPIFGGPDGSRTRDLMNAIHARSQLRYWPMSGETKDRKSTRLNSSHVEISYAVFCLKKKNKNTINLPTAIYNDTTATYSM